MATSGNYRKYRTTEDGKKYVHTINTKTGFASESNLLSASVISKSIVQMLMVMQLLLWLWV